MNKRLDWIAALGSAPIMFWQCPIPEHQGRYPEPIRQTVRWEGNVAYCTTDGCGNSSQAPTPPVASSPVGGEQR